MMNLKPGRTHKLILVVEDSPVQLFALTKLLEQQNLVVVSAVNGLEGVILARCYVPDLIVMDVQMPEMNGLEACERLKSNPVTRDIPVILFTAHSEPEVLKVGFDNGAVDFIPKDAFSGVVLLETLRQLEILPKDSAKGTTQTRTMQEREV